MYVLKCRPSIVLLGFYTLTTIVQKEIQWSFGWNSELGLISISQKETERLEIFITNAHVGIILECNTTNIKSKTMTMLTGHPNSISSFDVNADGRWLVTANKGNLETYSMIIVWNILSRTPFKTLCSLVGMGISIIKFSVDSKYLVTVSTDNNNTDEQTIDLWDWTSDVETPTCSAKLGNDFDAIVHVTHCSENPNFYCITTKKLIFFMTLVENENKLTIDVPKRQDPKKCKFDYTQSTYVTGIRQVISASTGGIVSIWDDIDYNVLKMKYKPETNCKQFLKSVKLDDHCITTIICQADNIITGNTIGEVFVYDKSLCVLYHLTKFIGDPIVSIVTVYANDMDNKTAGNYKGGNACVFTTKNDNENHYNSSLTSDEHSFHKIGTKFTAQAQFKCYPFFISTRNCKIFEVDIVEERYVQLFEKCEDHLITAFEVHPEECFFIIGNEMGVLSVYDYQTKTLFASNADDNLNVNDNCRITCIKYSPNGMYLCYGRADGSFRFVDPRNIKQTVGSSFKWHESPIRHIAFSESSSYVVYTDDSFGIYLYGIIHLKKFKVQYYGCTQVHTGTVRSIVLKEKKTSLMVYSVGEDHKIVTYSFDKTHDKYLNLVKVMRTEPSVEPVCMMKSLNRKELNLLISTNDLRLSVWNKNRCVRTTMGVNLETPIRILKGSSVDPKLIFFSNDTDIGILRHPIDGNPYKNAAVLGSGTKLFEIGISWNMEYVFTISEDSSSVLMWSFNPSYLDELEKIGGIGLTAYSSLLEGGQNGSEMSLLKEYFYSVQLANNPNPETTVFKNTVDVCEIAFLMRAMGYYPSEIEISNMMYEMSTRKSSEINHPNTLVTFDEFVVLYLNYRPQIQLTVGDIRGAFDRMVRNEYGESEILTKESFVYMMMHLGSKISFRELKTIIHTLLKTTSDMPSVSRENINDIQNALPFTFTFKEVMSDLFGFHDTAADTDAEQ